MRNNDVKPENRSWLRENTKPRTTRSRDFEQEATERTEIRKAKSSCPASPKTRRPCSRITSSFGSALCSLCYLLFKAIGQGSSLCALCVLLGQSAPAGVHYVDVASTNATPPYTNWTTAATNIQDAVDAAMAGDEVVVTNGVYAGGGRGGVLVVVDKPLMVRSVNGPEVTTISGRGFSCYPSCSVRCVDLISGASLSGFTVTGGNSSSFLAGAGVCGFQGWRPLPVVSNCVIIANLVNAFWNIASPGGLVDVAGGGAANCTLNNCLVVSNSVSLVSYGVSGATIVCRGGGAYRCALNNCTLIGNSITLNHTDWVYGDHHHGDTITAYGGGADSCALNNCTLIGNSASAYLGDQLFNGPASRYSSYAGGASGCTLNNCTLIGNWALADGYCSSGACNDLFFSYHWPYDAYSCQMVNCIVGYPDHFSTLNHCCTAVPRPGVGNITNAPLFVDANGWANLRLQSNSPCINAGNNSYVTTATDLDGHPRIAGGTVDIGAYEFQSPASMISYAWLQQFNLPINSATDTADPDGDGVNNYHEWLAGTDPTNPLSSPAQLTITPSGVPPSGIILTWSTNAVGFTLQSTTNLGAVWTTNSPAPIVIGGQNTVTNPLSGPQQFYRLKQ
jgi:hypothetical protein